ncbi:MAG: glycosyltransferase [Bacteroidaceae bacterium]|nr:glycosyltransferase [Bacteroidaceae bacterium]
MDKSPKITVITVCYNSVQTIEKTVQSIVNQDYAHREYIVVDGLSTDGTLDIVDKYRSQIDIVISEKDKGISDAFNKGIRQAGGDLIVLINSDDILLEGALSKVAQEWTPEVDVLATNVIMKDAETGFECREKPSTTFPLMPFFRHVAHQGAYISRECYDKYGLYDTNIRWPMDLEFLMRVYTKGGTFRHVDIDTAVFVSGGTTNKNNILKKKNDYLYLVRKNGGNALQAWTFYLFLVATQMAKKVLSVFGKNFAQKLRYTKS